MAILVIISEVNPVGCWIVELGRGEVNELAACSGYLGVEYFLTKVIFDSMIRQYV